MKKSIIAILSIIIAIVLTGCNAQVHKIANSYKFGYFTENENGVLETFIYDVKSDENTLSSNTTKPPYILIGEGTYTVTISSVPAEDNMFMVETDFVFEGKYKYNDGTFSDEFRDTISGTSYAVIGVETFRATTSVKNFKTSLPVLEEGVYKIKEATYTVSTTYDVANSIIESNVTGHPNEKVNKNMSVTTKDRYLDNEHIFLAVRLQNLSNTFSDNFKVLDALNGISQTINFSTSTNTEVKKFSDTDYDCLVVTASLNSTYKGSNTVMFFTQQYSKKYYTKQGTALDKNVSLMLEFKQGYVLYTLKSYENFASQVVV